MRTVYEYACELLEEAEFRRDFENRREDRLLEKTFYEGEVRALKRILHHIAQIEVNSERNGKSD